MWIGDKKTAQLPSLLVLCKAKLLTQWELQKKFTAIPLLLFGTMEFLQSLLIKTVKQKEWSNQGNLHVWIGDAKDNAAPISVGSSQSQVADAMGTPREIHDYTSFTVWYYGRSTITFDKSGKVKEWSNYGELKLE